MDEQKLQLDKFKDLSRGVGADTSERRFKDALKKVAKAPPKPKKP